MRQGIAFVISAPSGAGKSTLAKMLCQEFQRIGYSVSCTTRPMRPGEIEGKDYFFMSEADFQKMREAGEFAEWAQVHGNFYGTPLVPVKTMLAAGSDVLFDIDVQGASQLKASLPDATFVFILPPSVRELRRRLRSRGGDSEQSLQRRMADSIGEMREAFWYDAIVVNDNLDKAYSELKAVYIAATLAPGRDRDRLEKLLEEAVNING